MLSSTRTSILTLALTFLSTPSLAEPLATYGTPKTRLDARVQTPETLCSGLRVGNTSVITTPNDGAQYTKLREAHWSQTAWKYPSCIYYPGTAEDLRSAVSVLIDSNGTFAIRGSGHSPLPLWANVDNGVLISTKMINDLEYDESSQTVRFGFGNTWGDLYKYLETFGRMALGGRAPTVGVATILGGGLSHLSNLYGFVSDSVLEFELIDASGKFVKVNATSNPDLFFALKAGASNFGVVTHATMQTYPLGAVWGGALVYTNDHRDDVMRAMADYQQSGQLDRKSALLSYMGISNNTLYVILAYLDAVERPAAFQPFYNIPHIYDGTRARSNFTDLISDDVDRVVPRWTFGATSFYLDNDTYVQVARIAQNVSSLLSTINGGSMVLMPQPISKSMVTESLSRGASPMTANLKATAQMWLGINIGWNLESDDGRVGEIMMETVCSIEKLTKSRGKYAEFIFLNDAYATQDALRSYGMNTYRRLRRISRTVDPSGHFQKRLAGGFKLGI